MLTAHERIARQKGDPALLRLHRALGRLGSVLTVMNTGAHPDDEASGLLAALRYAYGMRVVIACSTRGEGGQNVIGPELGATLGVLRTREMEEAARVLDADVAWLGHGPHDAVHDFGFSKDGDDTLARWGEATIVARLIEAYRRERPDIVIPTFLDVPGQHGHHRAMTRAALVAFHRAGDPAACPEQIAAGLMPWQPAKLYLPAWSGASSSYDDETPPPPATVTVRAPRRDAATGATYGQIGEWSRAFHLCQGMGVWRDAQAGEWPLHLAASTLGTGRPESHLGSGLPGNLGDLAYRPGLGVAAREALFAAQLAMARARAAFPDREAIAAAALEAAAAVAVARAECPAGLVPQLAHRLARKARELDAVLFEAEGIVARAAAQPRRIAPGGETSVEVVVDAGDIPVTVTAAATAGLTATVAGRTDGATVTLTAAPDAALSQLYPPAFDALGGNGALRLCLTAEIGGRSVTRALDLEEPLVILPTASLRLEPDALVLNLTRPLPPAIHIGVAVEMADGSAAAPALAYDTPAGWSAAPEAGGVRLAPPPGLSSGRCAIRPMADGAPARRVVPIAYDHVGRLFAHETVDLPVLAVPAALPEARIGYVGGGNDRVDVWLQRLGLAVTPLDAEALLGGDLDAFTTIVVGILAFGTRPDLAAARARLHRWTEAGGHLVTLYHRPSDGWDPAATPPRRLVIGTPSLRWRVTDPAAQVRHLAPRHPLLTTPNPIGPEDWAGWVKERGLYFAAERDAAYVPLLSMSDAGEAPLDGALVSAAIGRGRHTHVALALHRQLEQLVPGAFRLLANLVQPA